MKKLILNILAKQRFTMLTLAIICINCYSQTIDLEKTYAISSKAAYGDLGNVYYNEQTSQYELTYVFKSSNKTLGFETYLFDKDFNYINMIPDQLPLDGFSQKYPWFEYSVDEYFDYAIVPQVLGGGKLEFLNVEMKHKFKWGSMNYFVESKVVGKMKLPSSDSKNYYFLGVIPEEETGNLTLIYAIRQDKKTTGQPYGNEFHIIKINRNMGTEISNSVSFTEHQYLAFCDGLDVDPDKEGYEELILVFGPAKENLEKKEYDFKIVKLNSDLKITEEIPFVSKYSFWKIDDIIWSPESDECFYFGPADNRAVTYAFASAGSQFGQGNPFVGVDFTATQLMKVKGDQVVYLESTLTDDYTSKLKTPPGQTKLPAYRGNKFETDDYCITQKGDFFVAGQNWSTTFNPVAGTSRDIYSDVLAFHFDSQGHLVSQYGLDTRENSSYAKDYGTGQYFVEGLSHNFIYWLILETSSMWEGDLLQYPRIGKINLASGEISEFKIYGSENFFIDDRFPKIFSPDPDKVIYVCADKYKKNVGFLRLVFD
jgi:hypothetical protein